MAELASPRQLRTAYLRWALIAVPATLLLGTLSGTVANPGQGNPWFDALNKPALMPPGWVFGAVWSVLYILMGLSVALILNARGAKGRGVALTLFLIQLAFNLAWSPLFFAMHRIMTAFALIVAIFLWASVATAVFWKIRPLAAWLMLPYLAWLIFAGVLNWQVHALNPRGVTVIQSVGDTRIIIE